MARSGPAGHGRSGDQRASRSFAGARQDSASDLRRDRQGISSGPGARGRRHGGTEAKELFARLCDMELIQACTTIHGPSFTFRHPLIQEVAYAMQLRTRRARLHAAVAKSIEGLPWGQLDEFRRACSHITAKQPARLWTRRCTCAVPRYGSAGQTPWRPLRTGRRFADCCSISRAARQAISCGRWRAGASWATRGVRDCPPRT